MVLWSLEEDTESTLSAKQLFTRDKCWLQSLKHLIVVCSPFPEFRVHKCCVNHSHTQAERLLTIHFPQKCRGRGQPHTWGRYFPKLPDAAHEALISERALCESIWNPPQPALPGWPRVSPQREPTQLLSIMAMPFKTQKGTNKGF